MIKRSFFLFFLLIAGCNVNLLAGIHSVVPHHDHVKQEVLEVKKYLSKYFSEIEISTEQTGYISEKDIAANRTVNTYRTINANIIFTESFLPDYSGMKIDRVRFPRFPLTLSYNVNLETCEIEWQAVQEEIERRHPEFRDGKLLQLMAAVVTDKLKWGISGTKKIILGS